MFTSIGKYHMLKKAFPLDDVESLLYLLCFSLNNFELPWLRDYVEQTSTEQFIINRLTKQATHH